MIKPSPKTAIIFSYADAGLGHLRVANALADSLPSKYPLSIIYPADKFTKWLHRYTSNQPFFKKISELFQYGLPSEILTRAYIFYLRLTSGNVYTSLKQALNKFTVKPQNIVIVCTHFGLAHQLAWIKKRLSRQIGIQIFLAVQVTDDSPQLLWCINGADITFSPSFQTTHILEKYASDHHFSPSAYLTQPYPLSRSLTRKLSPMELSERQEQLLPDTDSPINLSIPLSGAAVGISFLENLIHLLHQYSARYHFYITSRRVVFTSAFLKKISLQPHVHLSASSYDHRVIGLYEELFSSRNISLEISKPSEQAFKSITPPTTAGGVIMLFTSPVGRQEYDNLDFLRRHNVIPESDQQQRLFFLSQHHLSPDHQLISLSHHWRGLILPADPHQAAQFINWCHQHHVFLSMFQWKPPDLPQSLQKDLSPNGTSLFWKTLLSFYT